MDTFYRIFFYPITFILSSFSANHITLCLGFRVDLISNLGHSQCKTLLQSPRQLITYYLWYFADVASYLLKKEVEKIRLQVLFRL